MTYVNNATTKHCWSQKLSLALKNPCSWMLKPVTFPGNSPTSDLWIYTNLTHFICYQSYLYFFKKLVQIYCRTHCIIERKTRLQKSLQKCESKEQYWVQNHLCNFEYWNALSGSSPLLDLKTLYLNCNNLVCCYSNYAPFCILNYAEHYKF